MPDQIPGAVHSDGAHTGTGKYFELHGENNNQHNTQPEGRHRDAQVGKTADDMIGQSVLIDPRQKPQRD